MKTKAAKAKGRRVAQETADLLIQYSTTRLESGDVLVTPSGVTGEDVMLSPKALKEFRFSIECKCQESISIWEALRQAQSHAEGTSRIPVLFFRRNRTKLFVSLDAEHFLGLLKERGIK